MNQPLYLHSEGYEEEIKTITKIEDKLDVITNKRIPINEIIVISRNIDGIQEILRIKNLKIDTSKKS